MLRFLIVIISGFLLSYLVYCCLLFFVQRSMLFPGGQIPAHPEGSKNVSGMEKLQLQVGSGRVEAWFLPPDMEYAGKPAPVIVFAHGNAELIDDWPEQLKGFTRLGLGVLLVEYPGYGRSGGSTSEVNIAETLVVAHDYLTARGDVDASRIVLMGRSLGGGAVCTLAARRPSAALILMSTFTSVRSFASTYRAPAFLVRDPFDNLAVVRAYDGPVLVVHGKNDEVIPYEHGVALSHAAKRSAMISYRCGHNDCPPDWEAFIGEVEAFLRNCGVL
jgi:fermentation-respiration switch protein FrsA (DUF1100 family)